MNRSSVSRNRTPVSNSHPLRRRALTSALLALLAGALFWTGTGYAEVVGSAPASPAGVVAAAATDTPTATSTSLPTATRTATATASPSSTSMPTSAPAMEVPTEEPTATSVPPGNDDYGNATWVYSFTFNDPVDTAGATVAGDDPNMGAANGVNHCTVWYVFTPYAPGHIRLDTYGRRLRHGGGRLNGI